MSSGTKNTETAWRNVPENIDEYEGFVYLIVNTVTNQKYIGRKYLKQRITKKVKGSSRRKHVILESDWKTYKSSSHDVLADINTYGIDKFEFFIIECYKTRSETIYCEVEFQIKNDVLTRRLENGLYEFYNTNIMTKFFRPKNASDVKYGEKDRTISKLLFELKKG